MDTIKINKGNTLMVAHQGLFGLEMGNTHAAFVAAGNRSYWGIETDVHVTLDGKFVCIHDDNTKRVALDNLVVEESTFDTLRSLHLVEKNGKKGRTDIRIPSLEEYVQICKKYEKIGVLELKNPFAPEHLDRIIEIIRSEDYLHGIVFISFAWENMTYIRSKLPEQPCQFLIGKEYPEGLEDRLAEYRLDLDAHFSAMTKERLDMLHSRGVKVNCWTVDTPEKAEELVEWGVDYITSNILE